MKKLLSLLFVALLSLTAWADRTVTFVPGTHSGQNTSATAYDEVTLDGVTLSGTKSALAANPYRFAAGSTATVASTVGDIKKIEFTCQGSYSQSYGPDQFYGDGYTCQSGSRVGTWQGLAASVTLNTASQVRCTQIVVTIAEEVVTELVPPVFHPDGGEFTGSLEVTLTCATENAQIFWFYGTEEDQGTHNYYNSPIYVNETTTLTAYSIKGGEISEYVTVTFTKVEQTVEAPVFTPAEGEFYGSIDVTLTCATPGATIYYSLDQELWSQYVDPIPVTDNITIWAKAKVGDVESEVVSATYTKSAATTVEVTFDGAVDKGDGDTNRHHYTVVKGEVTMYVGDGTVYPDHYRIYKSDTTAFDFTTNGAKIIKIELNGISGNTPSNLSLPEGQSGTYTTSGTQGVWTGSDWAVSFKVNSQVRLYTVTVTLANPFKPGDVNHDSMVDINDITEMIDRLLNNSANYPDEADVNRDGYFDINDITAAIDIVLGK